MLASTLLESLAARVRRLRGERGLTRQDLARRSGISVRFLARIESAEGNLSVRRLDDLARALGTTASDLVRTPSERAPAVVLVGLRGAGKSTVGARLATRLGLPFVEIDERIADATGLTLDQIFELHGEQYYRRLEHEILRRIVADGERVVVAAAGGVVNDPASWQLLLETATVIWLKARPEDHWNRVVAQGDRRPMADHPAAMEELRALLVTREPVYAAASIVVETSGRRPEDVVQEIVASLPHERGTLPA
jgi:XRE family aerobic/anaerobic benzoate catabolism transcriptional regulator